MIDGDGHISYNKNNAILQLCGTLDCVSGVFEHLKKELKLEDGEIYIRKHDGLAVMKFSQLASIKSIIHYIYDHCPVFLDRKKAVADAILTLKPRKIPTTKEELAKLLEEYKNLDGNKNKFDIIGKEIGMSEVTLRRRLKEFGIFEKELIINKALKILAPEALKKEFELLGSAEEIGKKHGICGITVRRALEQIGINWRIFQKIELSKEQIEEAYKELGSIKTVARKFKVSSSTIKYKINKFNIIYDKTPRNQFGPFKIKSKE